jgi:hypothetical protein
VRLDGGDPSHSGVDAVIIDRENIFTDLKPLKSTGGFWLLPPVERTAFTGANNFR